MSTESPAPTAPAKPPKPTRSPIEKLIVRTIMILLVALVGFEARAMYGYTWTIDYLIAADAHQDEVDRNPKSTDEDRQDAETTLAELTSEPYGALSFLMSPSVGEKKYSKPVTVANNGKQITLKDKDGNPIELDNEKGYRLPMRWYSIRDIFNDEPSYLLTVKFDEAGSKESNDDEVIGFFTDKDPAEKIKPGKYIPATEAWKMLGGGGGARPNKGGKGKGKAAPTKGDAKADDDGNADDADDEVKTDEASKAEEPTKTEPPEAEEKKAEEPKAEEPKKAEEAKPEEKAGDGKAEESKADEPAEPKAEESKPEQPAEKKAEEPAKKEDGGSEDK